MKILLASVSLLLASSPGFAAEPAPQPAAIAAPSAERVALARRFVTLYAPAEAVSESLREGALQGASEELAKIEDEDERAGVEREVEKLVALLEPKFREVMPKLIEAYAHAYAGEFSDDELKQMIAFLETPAGRHFALSTAKVDGDPLVLQAQLEMIEMVMPTIEQAKKEKCAERAAKRLAAGDTKAKCTMS